jgi:hypothetical protein
MEGKYVRLEPLNAEKHGDELFLASSTPEAGTRFRYLFEFAPESRQEFDKWLDWATSREDPIFFVVIDKSTSEFWDG